MMRMLVAGKRFFCPTCKRPRLISVSEHGGEIGPNRLCNIFCEGSEAASREYVRLVKRWFHPRLGRVS